MPDLSYSFLCACLRSDTGLARALMQDPNWDWERLFQAANDEAVLPSIAAFLCQTREVAIPSQISDFFAGVLYLNRERNIQIRRQVKDACRLLNEADIEPVLLKGIAYLTGGVYEDAGGRYLIDADLLTTEAQLETAAAALLSKGYVKDDTGPFASFRHHYTPLRRPGSIPVELHRSVGLGQSGRLLPAREMIEQSVPCNLDGIRVRMPCPKHLMTHLIIHSQMQHPYHERIWPPLRAMQDLVQLQRRFRDTINWANIEHRFRKAGQLGLLMLHLTDVRDALGWEPPIPIRLTGVTRLRRQRRRVLRCFPVLRYFDPVYMFSTVCKGRLRVLGQMLSTLNGWKHLVNPIVGPHVFRKLVADVRAGWTR